MRTPGWESVKENAAPLQRGRNISALERAAAGTTGSDNVLQPKRDSSEKRIDEYESLVRPTEAPHVTETGDDPLSHWMGYIKYYQENFPSDTHQQFLLMERCTRALVKMPQYADDYRFISVCAKYADKTKAPSQVFKYLHQQKVGQRTALFWVAWAYVAEKSNDFPFAEQIYKKGISKDAHPLNVLKMRHKQFQRRMSRHWLNNSQRNDQLDDFYDEEESTTTRSRGALTGLSQDHVRCNDRARTGPQISQRSTGVGRRITVQQNPQGISNTNNFGAVDNGFSIFVESSGENAPNSILDQPAHEHKRVIEREADRRKENILAAERWNERGGLHIAGPQAAAAAGGYLASSRHASSSSRGAPLPFAVFVDEECVARNERKEVERLNQIERHRCTRDDRTFRDRGSEGMAERLAKDPLRYVRDHSQFEADSAADNGHEHQQQEHQRSGRCTARTKEGKRSHVGFSKRLLKDSVGAEQSFEEARAKARCYTLALKSVSFNLIQLAKSDQSSQMELDEGISMDASMSTSSPQLQDATNAEQPRKIQRLDSRPQGRVLFQSEPSFENSLNQTAISTASSTVHEVDAVGVPTKKEEETINTRLAMRELSMMFSSPAFGVDGAVSNSNSPQNAMGNGFAVEEQRGANFLYANVGESLGTSMLDNSIHNIDDSNTENKGGSRNTLGRSGNIPGFDTMALRELDSSQGAADNISCSLRRAAIVEERLQQDPLRGEEVDLMNDPGFQIYEDVPSPRAPSPPHAFMNGTNAERSTGDIPRPDPNGTELEIVTGQKLAAAQSYKPPAGFDFSVHEDSNEQTENGRSDPYAQGDTATFSILDEAAKDAGEKVRPYPTTQCSHEINTGGGDTATFSLFEEISQTENPTNSKDQEIAEPLDDATGFSIFVDGEDDEKSSDHSTLLPCKSKGTSDCDHWDRALDYNSCHSRDCKMALRRLQSSSSVASHSHLPLLSLLSHHGKSFHLPHISLPRELRAKHLSGNTQFQIGKHTGVVSRELGRGAYGVVALMDVTENESNQKSTIALKAQSPTDCLALECEILRRLETRAKCDKEAYVFPSPLSFISLADGGILSMTAGSRTGLNLVDLANVYKIRLGERVPEIVVLHYVSRMLRHLEQLHWHGRILHCDIKPDNFVLTTLDCKDNAHRDIESSDLMLVDFGRAIDLESHSENTIEARSVMFHGDACCEDMKCVSMRAGKCWSYDIDTYGILVCAHVLLYGTHIKLKKGGVNRWYLASNLKRYWQRDLWKTIFETLLNLDDEAGVAIGSRARSLRSLREEIESYTSTVSGKLKCFLTRQISLLPESRDQLS